MRRTTDGVLSDGVSVTTSAGQGEEEGRVNIVGSTDAPTRVGVYHYIITGEVCTSGCDHCTPNTKEGTITVWEKPTVSAGTDRINCTPGQSTTLTGTATYDYGNVNITTWAWTSSADPTTPTNTSSVEAAPTTTTT